MQDWRREKKLKKNNQKNNRVDDTDDEKKGLPESEIEYISILDLPGGAASGLTEASSTALVRRSPRKFNLVKERSYNNFLVRWRRTIQPVMTKFFCMFQKV